LDRLERGLTLMTDIFKLSLPIDEETKKTCRSQLREDSLNFSSSSKLQPRKKGQFIESDLESDVKNKKIRLDEETDESTENSQKTPVAAAAAVTTATESTTATAATLISKDDLHDNSCISTSNLFGYSKPYSKQENSDVVPEEGYSHWQSETPRTVTPMSVQTQMVQQQQLVQQHQMQQQRQQQPHYKQRQHQLQQQQRQHELQRLRLREHRLQAMFKHKRQLLQKKRESASAPADATVTDSLVTTPNCILFQLRQPQQLQESREQRVRQTQQIQFRNAMQLYHQLQQLNQEEIIDLEKSAGKKNPEAEQIDETFPIEVGRTVTQFPANSTALEGEQFRVSTTTYVNLSRRPKLMMSDMNSAVTKSVEVLNSTLSRRGMITENGDTEEKKKRYNSPSYFFKIYKEI